MSILDAHKAITARFDAQWANATPVAWPNTVFVEPTDEAYVRFYILDDASYQRSIGDPDGKNRYRATGLVVVQVSIPGNQGDAEAIALADEAAAIFRNQKFGGVWTLTPSFNTVGQVNDRYQINVTIPYQQDEVL